MLLYEPAPLSAAETGTPLIRHGGDGATAQRHEGDGKNSALSGKQKGKKDERRNSQPRRGSAETECPAS